MNAEKQPMADAYERACDTCPFRDDCQAYKEAFGLDECLRDDYAKSLMDFLRHTEQERRNEKNNRGNS